MQVTTSEPEPLTITEAGLIRVPVVYGLADLNGIFYIGQTRVLRERLKSHLRGDGINVQLNARLSEAGAALRVFILHRAPADRLARERAEIMARTDLVNIVHGSGWALIAARLHARPLPPWKGRCRPSCPTAWADFRIGRDRRLTQRLRKMSDPERCAYEIALYAELPPQAQRRLQPWLASQRAPMLASMEAWDGR
jgi:hypothetical protein